MVGSARRPGQYVVGVATGAVAYALEPCFAHTGRSFHSHNALLAILAALDVTELWVLAAAALDLTVMGDRPTQWGAP